MVSTKFMCKEEKRERGKTGRTSIINIHYIVRLNSICHSGRQFGIVFSGAVDMRASQLECVKIARSHAERGNERDKAERGNERDKAERGNERDNF
jgi:hypothetical protein